MKYDQEKNRKKQPVLMLASVASMIDQFNLPNIRLMQKLGYEVHVCCNFSKGNTCDQKRIQKLRKLLKEMQVKCHQWDCPRGFSFGDCCRAYYQLMRLTRKYAFAWMHCHSPVGGAIARVVARRRNIRVIYTAHGFHFYKGAPLLNRTVLKWIENFLARYTDLLITINHEDFEAAKKFKLKKGGQVVFVPGVGIDLSLFDNPKDNIRISKRNELGLSETDIVMISMGDLVPRKNYGLAINALAGANVSNLHYLICGEGSEKDNLLSQSEKLGVKDRTHFLGYRTDIRELLYSSDIFIFPTLQEGLPRSAMEAMAAGLPCLMSDIRGNNDLIKDGCGGFLCKTDDLDIWSEKLRLLAEDRILRHKMGACNLARIIDFDISKVQNVMADVFSEDLLSVAKQDLGSSTITIGGVNN